jgi:hypothetical protein
VWTESFSPYDTYGQNVPGPLTTTLLAMFDNSSFYQTATNVTLNTDARSIFLALCVRGSPFNIFPLYTTREFAEVMSTCNDISYRPVNTTKADIDLLVYKWLNAWSNTDDLTQALAAGNYLSSKALLTKAGGQNVPQGSRMIATAAGTTVSKPDVSLPAKIVISVLLAVQVLSLIGLVVFIYSSKTWNRRLLPLMILLLGEGLEGEIPDLRLKASDTRSMTANELASVKGASALMMDRILRERVALRDMYAESTIRGDSTDMPTRQ